MARRGAGPAAVSAVVRPAGDVRAVGRHTMSWWLEETGRKFTGNNV